jgi:hypothetical protein
LPSDSAPDGIATGEDGPPVAGGEDGDGVDGDDGDDEELHAMDRASAVARHTRRIENIRTSVLTTAGRRTAVQTMDDFRNAKELSICETLQDR